MGDPSFSSFGGETIVVTKGRETGDELSEMGHQSYLMGCDLAKMGSGLGIAAHLATGADT